MSPQSRDRRQGDPEAAWRRSFGLQPKGSPRSKAEVTAPPAPAWESVMGMHAIRDSGTMPPSSGNPKGNPPFSPKQMQSIASAKKVYGGMGGK